MSLMPCVLSVSDRADKLYSARGNFSLVPLIGFVLSFLTVLRCFRIYDDDGNKKLDYREFVNGLNDYGVMLSKEEMQAVFTRFDRDKSTTIDFDEFLENLRVRNTQTSFIICTQSVVVVCGMLHVEWRTCVWCGQFLVENK